MGRNGAGVQWPRLTLPREIDAWSLNTLREKLVKTGTKAVRYAKYVTFQLAIPPPGVATSRC